MEKHRSRCPVNLALEIFGDKWTLLIIRDIMFAQKQTFRELLQSEEKIATNILADRLKRLETQGVLRSTPDPGHQQKIIYRLTEKGIDLLPILVEIGSWSLQHEPVDVKKHQHAVQLVAGGKALQRKVRKELTGDHLKRNQH